MVSRFLKNINVLDSSSFTSAETFASLGFLKTKKVVYPSSFNSDIFSLTFDERLLYGYSNGIRIVGVFSICVPKTF